MNRRTLISGVVASIFLVAPAYAQPKKVSVGIDIANKPFIFTQGRDYTGFSYDLWVELAKEIGVTYDLRAMEFSSLIPAQQTKNVDVAFSSIFITPQRKQVVDFSDPYYMNGTGILVPKDSKIKKLADASGKKLAAVTGSAQVAWIKENVSGAEVTQFPGITEAFLAIEAGRVDGVLYDYPTLAYYALTEGKDKVRLLEDRAGSDNPVGFAFPKGSPLVGPVNDALKKIRSDGRYDALAKKWFGNTSS
ncbi:MAG: transporter substrate-binding domain-containing protein [Alphaproteobacteria bacterium]|nr:transporter substrate-binding domain-containing protein [Alphaproteobacteria bacterium]